MSKIQTAEIEFHRRTLKIRPVELHTMPKWWMERICWVTSGWGQREAYQRMNDLDRQLSAFRFDHWGTADNSPQPDRPWWNDGGQVFVTEPYADYSDQRLWGETSELAKLLGVHFRILPAWESWWYPGNTIRIEFAPCRHNPICKRCKTREQMRDASRARKRGIKCK